MANGRNNNGTFSKGNSGGPGRPRRITEIAYHRALIGAVSVDDWMEVVQRAVADAKRGNVNARDWLTRYLVGEPVPISKILAEEAFDPDGSKKLSKLVSDMIEERDDEEIYSGEELKKARRLLAKSIDSESDEAVDDQSED